MAPCEEKRFLVKSEFGQFPGALFSLLIRIGVGDAGSNLSHNQIDKSFIATIELPVWVQCGNEHADGFVPSLPCNGNQASAIGRHVPASGRKIGKKLGKMVNSNSPVGCQ